MHRAPTAPSRAHNRAHSHPPCHPCPAQPAPTPSCYLHVWATPSFFKRCETFKKNLAWPLLAPLQPAAGPRRLFFKRFGICFTVPNAQRLKNLARGCPKRLKNTRPETFKKVGEALKNLAQRDAAQRDAAQCEVAQCKVAQCDVAQCDVAQCDVAQCSGAQQLCKMSKSLVWRNIVSGPKMCSIFSIALCYMQPACVLLGNRWIPKP